MYGWKFNFSANLLIIPFNWFKIRRQFVFCNRNSTSLSLKLFKIIQNNDRNIAIFTCMELYLQLNMKRSALHIVFSLLFSAIFLFAGTGYNIIQYCCNDCEEAGITMSTEMSCECIHQHHHLEGDIHAHHYQTSSVPCVHEYNKSCDIDRLTVDVPLIQNSNLDFTSYSLLFSELSDFQTLLFSPAVLLSLTNYYNTPPDIPHRKEGRQILSKISVLIIWFLFNWTFEFHAFIRLNLYLFH